MTDYQHPSFASDRDLRSGKRAQERILSPGPWCWPDEDADPEAYESALRAYSKGPGELEPGEVAMATVSRAGGSARGELWALQLREEPRPPSQGELVGAAREAWLDAQCALPRSLPLLWRAVHARNRQLGPIRRLHPERSSAMIPIDGRTCGLAFGLALASSVLGIPAPADVIAVATLDEDGALGRVVGLEDMLRAIDGLALSVRRVVVATAQRDEALELKQSLKIDRLEILSFATLSAALEALLDDPAGAIEQAPAEERGELVEAFFRLALERAHAALEWGPIERAAERALSRWKRDLQPHQRRALEFTRAIAARHYYKRGELPLPSTDWLDWFPRALRLRVLAHAAQQACDTGAPDPRAILELTRSVSPELSELLDVDAPFDPSEITVDARRVDQCFPAHLRLLGAIGRMRYSAMGDLRGAVHAQLAACVGWQRGWEYDETAYPLSALFTYVSALALDPDTSAHQAGALFDHVDALWDESQRGGRRFREDPYVRLARGRALATLLRHDEAARELDPLIGNLSRQAEQLRLSAARWRLHGADPTEAVNALVQSDDPRANLYRALRDLDHALSRDDAGAAASAARRLHAEQPALCDTLLAGAGLALDDDDAPGFLARRYPY